MRPWINARLRQLPEWAVWLAGALPLALLVFDTLTNRLGVDPIAVIEHRLGRTAIYFLIASLVVTPLMRFGRINAVPFRRALGLLAFSYLALHVAAWVILDMGLLWSQMLRDVIKRPYLLFGMGALLLLVPLAVTSNKLSIRRLGGRGWKRLHRAVYAAVVLAGLHWLWVGKTWHTKPLVFFAVILLLLAIRLLPKRQAVRKTTVKTAT